MTLDLSSALKLRTIDKAGVPVHENFVECPNCGKEIVIDKFVDKTKCGSCKRTILVIWDEI